MNKTGELGLVNALYGSGTVAGWYLTLLSCIVSWTLHPKKRHQDTISPDLVVSLTLPIVAVVNIISQVSGLDLHSSEQPPDSHTAEMLLERANAVEAPLVIIEAFMNIAAAMFLMAARHVSIRRALVVAIIGLLCFVTDVYTHSTIHSFGKSRLLSRNFIADSVIALTAIGLILGVLSLISLGIAITFFYNRRRYDRERLGQLEQEGESLEEEVAARQLHVGMDYYRNYTRLAFKDSSNTRYITLISFLFLPMSFIASFIGIAMPAAGWHEISLEVPSIGESLFPRSRSSLKDLDQKVAVLGGLTALGFSLYSWLAIRYKEWRKDYQRRLELQEQNNIRLRRILQSGG